PDKLPTSVGRRNSIALLLEEADSHAYRHRNPPARDRGARPKPTAALAPAGGRRKRRRNRDHGHRAQLLPETTGAGNDPPAPRLSPPAQPHHGALTRRVHPRSLMREWETTPLRHQAPCRWETPPANAWRSVFALWRGPAPTSAT